MSQPILMIIIMMLLCPNSSIVIQYRIEMYRMHLSYQMLPKSVRIVLIQKFYIIMNSLINNDRASFIICRINFFILCRIILKDVPDVLRGIFKKKIAKPLKIEKWEDTENCGKILEKSEKFKLALNDDQKKLLKNGQTEKWDTTLLKEVLLYSSLFPVADFFEEVEVKLIEPKTEVKSTKPKTEVKSTKPKTEVKTELIYVPSQDDSTRFKQDDVILIDNKGRALKVKIKSFEKGKITVDQKLPLKIKDSYDIYKCTEEWVAIKGLSDIRNTHCHDVKDHVEKAKLEEVMDKIKNEYEKLGVEKCRIDQMQELKSGTAGP